MRTLILLLCTLGVRWSAAQSAATEDAVPPSCANPAVYEEKYQTQLKDLADQVATASGEKDQAQARLNAALANVESLTAQIAQVAAWEERSTAFEAKAKEMEAIAGEWQAKASQLESSVSATHDELAVRVERAEASLASTENSLASTIQQLNTCVQSRDADIQKWQEEAEKWKQDTTRCTRDNDKTKADSEKLQADFEGCNSEKTRATTELEAIHVAHKKEIDAVEAKLAKATASLNSEKATHAQEKSNWKRQLHEATQERTLYSYKHFKRNSEDSSRILRAALAHVARRMHVYAGCDKVKASMMRALDSVDSVIGRPFRIMSAQGGKVWKATEHFRRQSAERRSDLYHSVKSWAYEASQIFDFMDTFVDVVFMKPFLKENPDLKQLVPLDTIDRFFFFGYLAVCAALYMRFIVAFLGCFGKACWCGMKGSLYYLTCCYCGHCCGLFGGELRTGPAKKVEDKGFKPAAAPRVPAVPAPSGRGKHRN